METLTENNHARLRLTAFIGWAVTIFLYSSLPYGKRPALDGPYEDKWVHLVVFFIFGNLLWRWMMTWQRPATEQRFTRFAIIAVCALIYAWSDEFHQSFVPGRVYDIRDVLSDFLGGVIAASVVFLPVSLQRRLCDPFQQPVN